MENNAAIAVVLAICVAVLVTLTLTETPEVQAARRNALYRKIGIDGIADIAANKREIARIHRGALIKFRSGDLVEVRAIVRDVLGNPKRLEGLTQSNMSRRLNVEDERCLYAIEFVIHQGDPRYPLFSAARSGTIDP